MTSGICNDEQRRDRIACPLLRYTSGASGDADEMRLCSLPASRRQCAGPWPSPVGMGRACAGAGRGPRARQPRARPDRAGALVLRLCRRDRRQRRRDEDALAYLRDAPEYRNVLLVEQPNGDFAATMMRQLFYAAFVHPFFAGLAKVERRDARRDRGQGGQGNGLSRAPWRRMGDPARRRHRGKPCAARSRRSTTCGPIPANCSRSMRSSAP